MLLVLSSLPSSPALDALAVPGALGLVATALHLAGLELRARSSALFVEEHGRLWLVVSERLDQAGLDVVAAAWTHPPTELIQGSAFLQGGSRPFLLLPCMVCGAVRGVAYIELPAGDVRQWPSHIQSLVDVVGRAVARLENELAQRPDELEAPRLGDPEAVNLALLLERNEWNVARVARLLGVTRMTVYNRMKKHGLPRQRVPKNRKLRAGKPRNAPQPKQQAGKPGDASPHQREAPSA